jgi:formate dehydrogenase subunit gamma
MTGTSEKRILRYTLEERVVHWIAGIAYVYVLLSGLALWSPRLYWLASVLGGGPTARAWHPWAGVIFTLAAVWMYRMWRGDMRITERDRVWQKAIGSYIRNEDHHLPPIGRFNAGQKWFFWVMVCGGFLLLLSGLVLWFPEFVPWSLRAVRGLAVLTHVIAALVTIGGFIIHVYMGTAVVRGGFTSIVRGEVSENWAKTHHALWLREMKE